MRRLLALVAFAAGCASPPADVEIGPLDEAFYAERVHPLIHYSCAALECHGVEARPLRLYSEDGLRMRASLRGEPLSAAEAEANVWSFAGIDPDPASPDDHMALLMPLRPSAGGIHHAESAGEVWPDRDAPGYRCLRGWLAGDPSVASVCDAAAAAVTPAD